MSPVQKLKYSPTRSFSFEVSRDQKQPEARVAWLETTGNQTFNTDSGLKMNLERGCALGAYKIY